MDIIPTKYIERQIAIHAAIQRVADLADREPTTENLIEIDVACGVVDALSRADLSVEVCRCGHRSHSGACGVFVERRAQYCACAAFEDARVAAEAAAAKPARRKKVA